MCMLCVYYEESKKGQIDKKNWGRKNMIFFLWGMKNL